MEKRKPKVWCDEDTSLAQPGDYYLDCMGTWIIDPDGSWRGYYNLTKEELAELKKLIEEEKNG